MFTKLYNLLIDILFPIQCLLCDTPDTMLCETCFKQLPVQPTTVQHPSPNLDTVTICADYRDERIQKLIATYKFSFIKALGKPLSDMLAAVANTMRLTQGTVITPIPLHRRRERMRGFNQSAILADFLAAETKLQVDSVLKRVRARRPQHTLNRRERLINMKGVYRYAGTAAPASVLLIDDIATTFATLNEAASELKKHGTTSVHALVLAKNDP